MIEKVENSCDVTAYKEEWGSVYCLGSYAEEGPQGDLERLMWLDIHLDPEVTGTALCTNGES